MKELICLLIHQLHTDDLTGIPNMRALEDHTKADGGYYVFADMDKMGAMNKTLGHDRVNDYLKEFADWLSRNVRESDSIACRKHGDEFLCWLPTRAGAASVRDRIRVWRSMDGRAKCSAGIGTTQHQADLNCSRSKKIA